LIKGHGLKVMDKNMFSKGGSSDPMCLLQLDETEKKKSSIQVSERSERALMKTRNKYEPLLN